jgi:hypothetical protein
MESCGVSLALCGKCDGTGGPPLPSADAIRRYLLANGWEPREGPGGIWTWYSLRGSPQVGLPLHETWDDYRDCLRRALQRVATVENRTAAEVCALMGAFPSSPEPSSVRSRP